MVQEPRRLTGARVRGQRGVTLIELVISIVIIGISAAGILMAIGTTSRHSADPMVRQQALAIAEAYLEEILLQSFAEPPAPFAACSTGGLGAEGGEIRANYDDVDDYHGLVNNGCNAPGNGACDQFGNPIAGLEGYSVQVNVACEAFAGIPATDAKHITVSVSHPTWTGGAAIAVSSYRTLF